MEVSSDLYTRGPAARRPAPPLPREEGDDNPPKEKPGLLRRALPWIGAALAAFVAVGLALRFRNGAGADVKKEPVLDPGPNPVPTTHTPTPRSTNKLLRRAKITLYSFLGLGGLGLVGGATWKLKAPEHFTTTVHEAIHRDDGKCLLPSVDARLAATGEFVKIFDYKNLKSANAALTGEIDGWITTLNTIPYDNTYKAQFTTLTAALKTQSDNLKANLKEVEDAEKVGAPLEQGKLWRMMEPLNNIDKAVAAAGTAITAAGLEIASDLAPHIGAVRAELVFHEDAISLEDGLQSTAETVKRTTWTKLSDEQLQVFIKAEQWGGMLSQALEQRGGTLNMQKINILIAQQNAKNEYNAANAKRRAGTASTEEIQIFRDYFNKTAPELKESAQEAQMWVDANTRIFDTVNGALNQLKGGIDFADAKTASDSLGKLIERLNVHLETEQNLSQHTGDSRPWKLLQKLIDQLQAGRESLKGKSFLEQVLAQRDANIDREAPAVRLA